MKTYERQIQVTNEHLDFNNHVNNLVYLQWAVDTSREHWMHEISEEIDEKYFWMVRTHHATYKKQAFQGDLINVKTFVAAINGPFSERIVQIFKQELLLVEVKTTWCLIDRLSQKPIRVPEEIQVLFK